MRAVNRLTGHGPLSVLAVDWGAEWRSGHSFGVIAGLDAGLMGRDSDSGHRVGSDRRLR